MGHKIALLSDIHGNVTAFEAVLADAKAHGVDEYWLLGDSFLPGPADHTLLTALETLPVTAKVRGNWEDFICAIVKGQFDWHSHADLYFARMVQYLMERSERPVLAEIEQLPTTLTLERAGLRFHLCHHLPDKTYGRELLPHGRQEDFDKLLEQSHADIAIYGHCHQQLLRYSSHGQLIINPGSIGQPYFTWPSFKTDLRAQYAILVLEDDGLSDIVFRKVAFDKTKELALAKERQLPYLDLYQELLETGVLHTHDEPYLQAIHAQTSYIKEVKAYFQARGFSTDEESC